MTLRFIDGAQGYNTAQAGRKWTGFFSTPTVNATGGRRGGPSIRQDNWGDEWWTPTFASQATWIVGVAIKIGTLPAASSDLLNFIDTATIQCSLCLESSGVLTFKRGIDQTGTTLGTTTAVLTAGVFAYIEVKVTISDTVGTVDIRKDGVSILSLTGLDTKLSANATANIIAFGGAFSGGAVTNDFDDFYICDNTGATNNNFLGDCRVDTTFPNGAGALSQWTPSAGSNYQNVDEDPANDDTDYNFASAAASRDLYAFPDIPPTTGTVYGVVVNMTARKDDATARTFRELTRSGGSNFTGGTTHTLTTSYAMYQQVLEQDPNTAAAWSIANVNLAEFGVDLVS